MKIELTEDELDLLLRSIAMRIPVLIRDEEKSQRPEKLRAIRMEYQELLVKLSER